MLELSNVDVHYGHIQALKAVSLSVPTGGIFAVLGANGAGKTTLIRAVMGLVPQNGTIAFEGAPVGRMPTHLRVERGIALVPEGRRLFPAFTVEENLMIGAYRRRDTAEISHDLEKIYTTFPILRGRRRQLAGTLSGGEGQMVAIGRALMARPRLLLLDEPSVGLMPRAVSEIFEMMRTIPAAGVTVLLVEQNARKAVAVARRVAVLELGRVVLEGEAAEVARDPRIQDAYLGR
jgi:branched-chain amino acid transport system ATP-binding protein